MHKEATSEDISVVRREGNRDFNHLKNLFASGEQFKNSVTEKNSATAVDGKNYMTQFFNLDAIIRSPDNCYKVWRMCLF